MTVAPFAKPGSREALEAQLAAMDEAREAEFAEATEAYLERCLFIAVQARKPGIRNIARVLAVHLDREGKALKAIRGVS